MKRTAVMACVVALFVGACGSEDISVQAEPTAADSFTSDAARLCTEIANDALDTPARAAANTTFDIAALEAGGHRPSESEFERWIGLWEPVHERLVDSVDSARTLTSDDPATQSAWDTVVTGGAEDADFVRARLDALRGRDLTAYPAARNDRDDVQQALETLGLADSDCGVMFEPPGVAEADRAFVRAATTACTDIGARRLAAGYEKDARAVLDTTVAVQEGETTLDPDLGGALGRVSAEWRSTVTDFEAVADAPSGWEQILDTARERRAVAEQRSEVARNPSDISVAEAFKVGAYSSVGFDFRSVGLADRSCRMVAS